MRKIFGTIDESSFPNMVYLSDGGHVDNTGLVALIITHLNGMSCKTLQGNDCSRRVCMVDGGASSVDPVKELKEAISLVRTKLACHVRWTDKSSVYLRKFYESDWSEQAQAEKWEVPISDCIDGVPRSDCIDEVLDSLVPLLARSNPDHHRSAYLVLGPIKITGPKIVGSATPLKLDVYYARLLPKGEYPAVNGACCMCCHVETGCAAFVSPCLFGKFPNHGTHVQFFTERLFNIYHRSGQVLGAKIVKLLAPAPPAQGSTLLASTASGSGTEILETKCV
jgi:hypothetical protein